MPNVSKLACLLAVSLLPLACMKPNPLIDTLGDGDDETGETGMPGESGESETGNQDPGDGDGESGNDDSSHVDLDLGSDPVCGSVEPFEPACSSCLAGGCCELLSACAEADDCACLAACMLAGGNNGACKNACNGTHPNSVPQLSPLLDCAAGICDADCQ